MARLRPPKRGRPNFSEKKHFSCMLPPPLNKYVNAKMHNSRIPGETISSYFVALVQKDFDLHQNKTKNIPENLEVAYAQA